ncbi:alpha/beta fold hydrolase [Lampropedia puyangensis]|uniref:Alpha/beta fold hydrolase n=1 Tax=Lampropedia puyangensis TaxID=1330072 RepID=A0A4S8EXC1_9BURK|nr:alpha/beta fold hydrolase [Lampropedia puyangensis]THT98494.1 alpha/beta fold hydrolase [Lampropedia puyangensis]
MSLLAQARQHVCRVGGAELVVYELGQSQAQPLLLLHGGMGSSHDWDSVVDALAQSFRLLLLDFRGHGRSSMGALPLSYAQHAADVVAVLDHLKLASVNILGFSDGGITGYRLALQCPVRVQALATVGAQWRLLDGDPSIPFLQGLTRQRWEQLFPHALSSYEQENPQPDFDALLGAVKALWLDRTADGYPSEAVRGIQAPLLLIRGDNDPLLSLAEVSALQDALPHAHLWNQAFSGHAVHDDAAEAFLKMVVDFFCAPSRRRTN